MTDKDWFCKYCNKGFTWQMQQRHWASKGHQKKVSKYFSSIVESVFKKIKTQDKQ